MNGDDTWIILGTLPAQDDMIHSVIAVPAVVKQPNHYGVSIVEVTWKVHKETYMVHGIDLTPHIRKVIWVILSTISYPGYAHYRPCVEAIEVTPGIWERPLAPPASR